MKSSLQQWICFDDAAHINRTSTSHCEMLRARHQAVSLYSTAHCNNSALLAR